jgi:asparagine synthase (glutamine-hydrolysing)
MCGLVGSYCSDLDHEGALAAIAHRGPDGSGSVQIGDTWLGHTRLAIQDLRDIAGQPFRYGNVTLTYNGELWNGDELRATLPGPWATTGDTEVVAAVLDRHGVGGLDLLDGFFAVAWHDTASGTWLARDRYGKVPLYLSGLFGSYLWASEIKALPFGSSPAPVAPGHAICLDTDEEFTWAQQTPTDPITDPWQVHDLLRDGVKARLLSDRPVCFLLSGGLDSTFVLRLARDLHPNPVAYTAVYDPDSADLHAARYVAREFDIPLVEVPVPDPTPEAVEEAVRAIEVPMKAQVEIALANLPLARAIAADGFRVVLSGEAADELFGGYGSMCIQGAKTDDKGWEQIRRDQVTKMSRGNFMRVNKVFMAAGVEARLPFMHRPLVDAVLATGKATCPPGKGLLKQAAQLSVPPQIIRRPKDTFQGGSGIAAAAGALSASPTVTYHNLARSMWGYLPKG